LLLAAEGRSTRSIAKDCRQSSTAGGVQGGAGGQAGEGGGDGEAGRGMIADLDIFRAAKLIADQQGN
jgi:hypothetical protein